MTGLISTEPESKALTEGLELTHGEKRYCLWLLNTKSEEIRKCPQVLEKIKSVQLWRQSSLRKTTQNLATTPGLFAEIRQPNNNFLAIPTVSSERKLFLP
jgi:hypothetical protein